MLAHSAFVRGLAAGLALCAACAAPAAGTLRTAPAGADLAAILRAAAPGDTVRLGAGVHAGPIRIERAIVLAGEPGAVIDGRGRGTVILVAASGAVIADLEVRGSGRRVITVDTGIHVESSAGVRIERVRMRDVLYGVYGERSDSLRVEDCDLEGRVKPLDESGEGNGLHFWTSSGVRLHGNRVSHFLDAIYLSFSNHAGVTGNTLSDNGRYGLHTMYCMGTHLIENRFTRNAAGIAIMFSNRLVVERNAVIHNRGPRTYGLLLRDCSDGVFEDNRLVDNTVALFLDGSNRNRFRHNLVQDNGWGVLLFASSADNLWVANDFIQNDYPVALDMRRTRNRFDDGAHGNYWSDAETYDLDGNGVSDAPHAPVSAFAFVSKQYPDLAVLAKSPAVAALSVAERVFPALRPSELVDGFPLTHPAGARAPLTDAAPERPSRAWGHLAGFSAAWLAGIAGLLRRRAR